MRIGLVPTMGNLHPGHISLVSAALGECDVVIATIFVNPTQFGPTEDLDAYPRTPEADLAALEEAGATAVFLPGVEEMFGSGERNNRTIVHVPEISGHLCGASRPGHFDGVTTIVMRLMQLAQPTAAFFGEKDYQQLTIIRQMVEELDVPVEIHGIPTVREADGLAMSSRNGYLTPAERATAPALQRVLRHTADRITAGDRNWPALCATASAEINAAGLRTDYVEIRDADTLAPLTDNSTTRAVVVLAAAWLGQPRLIDNLRVTLP